MFDELSSKLSATLQRLAGRGVLTEEAVKEGLREVRRVLLEADVSFDLTREFLERVQAQAVGTDALKVGAAGPAARQDRLRRAGGVARREAGAARLRLGAADDHPARGAAGLGQDDHRRQAGASAQARAEGAVPGGRRRLPARRRGSAGYAGGAGGRRGARRARNHRRGRDRAARHRGRREGAGAYGPGRHRRPPADRRRDDGRAGATQGSGPAARDPAGGRRDDRPGRGADRAAASTTRLASPA